jgi:rhamnose utilization protein RhaD (predicted bifunctional aldolase and dehydrogenase)
VRREWDAPGVVAEGELAGVPAPVVELVRASRLLGGDEFLVLHGGGNSSAKQGRRLWVKASGHDMGSIGPAGLPAVDRDALDALMEREAGRGICY